jgi:hypothetical protein
VQAIHRRGGSPPEQAGLDRRKIEFYRLLDELF